MRGRLFIGGALILFSVFTFKASGEDTVSLSHFNKDGVSAFAMGVGKLYLHEYEDALVLLKRAVQADPGALYPRFKLAEVMIQLERTEEAKKVLIPLADQNWEASSDANILLAKLSLSENNKLNALSYLSRAQTQNPSNKGVFLVMIELYQQLGMTSEKIDVLKKALVHFPGELKFIHDLGNELLMQKKYEEAKEIFLRGLKSYPKTSSLLIGLSNCMDGLGDFSESVVYLKKALSLEPLNLNLYQNLVGLCVKLEDWEAAFSACEDWISITPDRPMGFLQYAYVALKSGQVDRGISYLEKYSEQFSSNGEYFYWLARMYHKRSDIEAALQYYRKAITFLGFQPELSFTYAMLIKQMGKINEAIEVLKKCVETNVGFAEGYNFLGYLLLERGVDPNEAIINIEKALKLQPENPAFLDSMGWAYYKKGRFKEARIYQEEAFKRDPQSYEILHHLFLIYKALGEQKESRKIQNLMLKIKKSKEKK